MIYFHIGKVIFTEHPELKQYVKICNSIRDINRDMPKYAQQNVTTYITMQVIASVEKYENAGMKFSTVPAFALAESRASDACCLFLVQKHTRAKSACCPPQESSDQVLELIADVATHSLDPRAATRAVPVRNLPAAAHAALL